MDFFDSKSAACTVIPSFMYSPARVILNTFRQHVISSLSQIPPSHLFHPWCFWEVLLLEFWDIYHLWSLSDTRFISVLSWFAHPELSTITSEKHFSHLHHQRMMKILIWKLKASFCLYISWNRNQTDKSPGRRGSFVDIKVRWTALDAKITSEEDSNKICDVWIKSKLWNQNELPFPTLALGSISSPWMRFWCSIESPLVWKAWFYSGHFYFIIIYVFF